MFSICFALSEWHGLVHVFRVVLRRTALYYLYHYRTKGQSMIVKEIMVVNASD